LAENEARREAASRMLAPGYLAKLTHFLAFGYTQFSAIASLARCQKPFCECSPFYAPGGIFRHLASCLTGKHSPPGYLARIRQVLWQSTRMTTVGNFDA